MIRVFFLVFAVLAAAAPLKAKAAPQFEGPYFNVAPADCKHTEHAAEEESGDAPHLLAPVVDLRVNSPFGMRKHPIQGRNRLHTGVDFAGKSGDPVMAAADGVIVQAKARGGYGNMITIAHGGAYRTRYAHLSAFAPGLKPGVRVRSGDVIGYVGTTGAVTGPNLHFELRRSGRPLDPLRQPETRVAAR